MKLFRILEGNINVFVTFFFLRVKNLNYNAKTFSAYQYVVKNINYNGVFKIKKITLKRAY